MDFATRLDPAEVLDHLKQLGYTGITPEQLKAFMNDLKKLILHEQMMSSSVSSSENYTTSLSYSPSSSSQTSSTSCSSSSFATDQHDGASSSGSRSSCASELGSSGYERIYSGKENTNRPKKTWSASSSDIKPKSSFIRPWNLNTRQPRSARSDPVSLYHHYKTLWEQQKFPGENDHADLRWLIRERMLGQDPHPTSHNVVMRQPSKGFRL